MADAATARITVLGSGAWGTALANLSARTATEVLLWARDAAHVAEIAATGVNARRLPKIPLLSNVLPTANLADIFTAELVLAAVPAQAFRAVLEAASPFISADVPIVVCAKGIENATGLFMSDIVGEILPKNPPAILSGPSFALDVAQGQPTAVTIAAADKALAASLAQRLGGPNFRLYYTDDMRGVEIGGAAKNVLAIACGIAAGRGLGASAGAALIARGFAELSRFGRAFGANAATLMGLSGLGDLVLTCSSRQSRNFSFGFALGQGQTIAEVTNGSGLVEGVATCGVLNNLSNKKGVEMPIASAVDAVLAERMSIDEAIETLMARPSKAEQIDFT